MTAKLNIADEPAGGPQIPEELADGRKREAEMPRAEIRADLLSRVRPLGHLLKTTAIAAFESWQRSASRRRAIADLSPDQLKDIGQAEAPTPVLEVKPGLVTNLMSMR